MEDIGDRMKDELLEQIKIPKHFKIGATNAYVHFKKYLKVDEGYDGTFNRRTDELQIDSTLVGCDRDKVFGHELMEVIKHNYEIDTSEKDMSRIANGWIEFLTQLGIEFDWSDIKEKND